MEHANYSGGHLKSPLSGNLTIKLNNFVWHKSFLLVPNVPSGHYRIDTIITEVNRKDIYAMSQFHLEK